MKRFLRGLLGLLLLGAVLFPQPAKAWVYFPPYYYTGYVGAVPYGYGYYPIFGPWAPLPPGYGPYANYGYGYSYFPYYGYLPYYATYAAIAYSRSGDVTGGAWGQSFIGDAASAAIQSCGHEDCRSVVWVQGGCAAVSVSQLNGALGWAYGWSRANAEQSALRACRNSGGGNKCVHRGWVCSW